MIDRFFGLSKKIRLSVVSFGLGLIALCLILVGQSYAIFSGTTTDTKEQIVKLGNLEVVLNEPSTGIDLGLSPMSDVEGLLQEDVYSFSVENTGSADAKYRLLLIDDEASVASYSGTLLDKGLIKLGLEVNGEEKGPYTLSELNNLLNEKELKSKRKDSYKLRLWLSEEVNLDEIAEQKVFLKLELEAEQYFSEIVGNLDNSGANQPALTSNMIPVYYDSASDSWKKADSDNADKSSQWYDYDNKMWANAVTVSETNRQTYLSAKTGTTIPMSDINTMWVWVPRYTYTYLNTNTPQEINVKFESGTASTGTIKCTDNVTGTSSTSETCTDTTNNGLKAGTSTYTHPAFTFGDQELTGIWVGKFEISSGQIIKPNVTSLRSQTVNQLYTGIYNMRNSGNAFGFSTTDETHMMKNMEWGAVTYLSHSKYGINKEIAINSANTYTTGCGPQSEGSTSSGATCNGYTTALGQSASTTGNTSGVYDMSGGAYEYVMGNMVNSSGAFYSSNAGFSTAPDAKYYDKYSYDASSNTTYTRGKLGDATKEMAPTGTSGNWYSDYAYFPYSSSPWFFRGGLYGDGACAGAFLFYFSNGSAFSSFSSRAVLGVLD